MQQRNDSRFKKVKDAILERDNSECRCGNVATTVRYLDGKPRKLDASNLDAVCPDCQIVYPAGATVYDARLAREGIGTMLTADYEALIEARRAEKKRPSRGRRPNNRTHKSTSSSTTKKAA